jgi:hypothetical protein
MRGKRYPDAYMRWSAERPNARSGECYCLVSIDQAGKLTVRYDVENNETETYEGFAENSRTNKWKLHGTSPISIRGSYASLEFSDGFLSGEWQQQGGSGEWEIELGRSINIDY